MFSQGQVLVAKQAFSMKRAAKGRAMQVRQGDRFWVTNTEAGRAAFNGLIMIDREGKGQISCGYPMSVEQIETYFEIGT